MNETKPRRPRFRAPALAAIAVLVLAGCGGRTDEEITTSDRVPVSVEPARRGPIRAAVHVTGVVKPAPGADLLVVPPQAARILEMPRAVGDRVRRGDLLVRFEIPALDAERAQRESERRSAAARKENASATVARVRGLFERGIAARKEVEDAERDLEEADADLAEAESTKSAANLLAERETVRAPFGGVVASRSHNPGDLVDPAVAGPILRLIDPTRIQVEATVPVDALPGLSPGSPARVLGPPAYPPEDARLLALPVAVEPATGTAPVRLEFASPSRLPAGMTVRVEIFAEVHPGAVLVPASALVREGDETFVYTVDPEGKAHRRKAAVGIVTDRDAEILSGIEPGEKVVVEGQNGLPDGAQVSIRS